MKRIAERPKEKQVVRQEKPSPEEEAFMFKGGSIAGEAKADENMVRITVRLPPRLLRKVDTLIESILTQPSRSLWILQAVAEKVERDTQGRTDAS